jgi:UDP-N-acetylglucosamine 4,6-dehydratase
MGGGEIFVPRIPSMRIVDLAEAIAPGAIVKEIGIRPGEKMHEALLTADEAREAREYPTHFVIGGLHPRPGGRSVPDGFAFTSDHNTLWLGVERLRELLEVEAEDGG